MCVHKKSNRTEKWKGSKHGICSTWLIKQGPEILSRTCRAISALKSEGIEPCEQGEGTHTARGRTETVANTWGAIWPRAVKRKTGTCWGLAIPLPHIFPTKLPDLQKVIFIISVDTLNWQNIGINQNFHQKKMDRVCSYNEMGYINDNKSVHGNVSL